MSIFKKIKFPAKRFSFYASITLHILIIGCFFIELPVSESQLGGGGGGNGGVDIEMGGMGGSFINADLSEPEENEVKETSTVTPNISTDKINENQIVKNSKENKQTGSITSNSGTGSTGTKKGSPPSKGSGGGKFNGYAYGVGDTAGLSNTYKEKTLNVSINYPSGWTFVDQNVRNKLDGVTFWFAAGTIKPPPYVHLNVEDKDLFDPRRYKYSEDGRNCEIYFNDPEEMAGQVVQTFYLHTGNNEDYSLKLIVKGSGEFKALQSTFFGMLKTFRFGNKVF